MKATICTNCGEITPILFKDEMSEISKARKKLIEDVLRAIEGKAFIAGGSALAYIQKEYDNFGDIDIYLIDASSQQEVFENIKKLFYNTNKVIKINTYSATITNQLCNIQVIRPNYYKFGNWFGEPDHVVDTFDLDIVRCYLIYEKGEIYQGVKFPEALKYRKVQIVSNINPLGSIIRIIKYTQRGYTYEDDLTHLFYGLLTHPDMVSVVTELVEGNRSELYDLLNVHLRN